MSCTSGRATPSLRCRTSRESHPDCRAAPPVNSQNLHLSGVAIGREKGVTVGSELTAIISNSFALDPTDKELARKKLTDAGKLANEVPAYEISYPRDYARIPDVHAAIFEKLAQGRSFAEPLGISATA